LPRTEEQIHCEHRRFEIRGDLDIGDGQCLDCRDVVNVAILFDRMAKRLMALEEELRARLG